MPRTGDWTGPAVGLTVGAVAAVAGWFDLPDGSAALPLAWAGPARPAAVVGAALGCGLVGALLGETLLWLARALGVKRWNGGPTGWVGACRQDLFPDPRERLTQVLRQQRADAWSAGRCAGLLGRWRWYFLLSPAPALAGLWCTLDRLQATPRPGLLGVHGPLWAGTLVALLAALLALASLWLAQRVVGRLPGRILEFEVARTQPPSAIPVAAPAPVPVAIPTAEDDDLFGLPRPAQPHPSGPVVDSSFEV